MLGFIFKILSRLLYVRITAGHLRKMMLNLCSEGSSSDTPIQTNFFGPVNQALDQKQQICLDRSIWPQKKICKFYRLLLVLLVLVLPVLGGR